MRLVPRQLRRSGFPGSVPYYGGRLTPGVIAGLGRPAGHQPGIPPMGAQPLPDNDRARALGALDELRRNGVLSEEEYTTFRQRLGSP